MAQSFTSQTHGEKMNIKKLTKKQKKEMLYNAVMIAEGAMEPTPDMQACQFLVDTGEVWKLQGWFGRAAFRMISDGSLDPAPVTDDTQDNGDNQ
jgi:hypothetical protein